MKMGDLSPVIQAFLGGQAQASENITKAAGIKQKQQELEQLMKQFNVKTQQEQDKLELEHQIFQLNHKKAMSEEGQRIFEQLRKSPETAPGTTNFEAPGINMAIPGQPGVIQQGAPRQVTTAPQPGSPVTMDTAFGPITLNMPQSEGQEKLEQARQQMPLELEKARVIADINTNAYVKKMMPELERKLQMQQAIHEAQIEALKRGQDMSVLRAEIANNAHWTQMLAMQGIEANPEAFKAQVANAAAGLATGRLSNTDLAHAPIILNAAHKTLSDLGYAAVPNNFRTQVFPNATNAAEFMNNIENLRNTVNIPTSIGGRVRNVASELTGIEGLSTYRSLYEMFRTSELPKLDLAVGLTPGTLARSPKLVNLFKNLYPQPGDKPEQVNQKQANGVDIYLSGIQSKLSQFPAEQRKNFWREIVQSSPDLLNNSIVAGKLNDTLKTGNYSPGSIFKELQGSLGGK